MYEVRRREAREKWESGKRMEKQNEKEKKVQNEKCENWKQEGEGTPP